MRVRRLPIDPGPAGWNCLLPAREGFAPLAGPVTADWLIIGAGFAGLAAAQRLRQLRPNDRIVMLEARLVAEGPAGRNSGFMIDLPHDLASDDYGGALESDVAQTAANRAAIAFAGDMAEEFGLSDVAFAPIGKVNAAATSRGHQHNLDYARHLGAMGEACEMLDAQAMEALTGTRYYRSGLYTPGTAVLQPAMFVREVADGLVRAGVTLFENSPVVDLTRAGDWIAKTPEGQVTAPKVILAVNGHLSSFGHYKDRLMHVFTYASMTRPLGAEENLRLSGAARWGVTSADPMGTTVRKIDGIGGTRIVVRNRFTYQPSLEITQKRLEQVCHDHDRAFAARFPMLKGIEMDYRWGGRLCLSRNNVQVVKELTDGLFSACCQNGLGTAKGTLGGMVAAEAAAGEVSPLAASQLAAPEPQLVPTGPITKAAANAYMRFQEWRAGREL